jgi:glycosyltransferase involved in cell wall biosynthesis
VTTIHDLTLVDYGDAWGPSILGKARHAVFQRLLSAIARRSTEVIAPSEYVRQQIVSRYSRPARSVTTIHQGIDAPPRSAVRARCRTLLYVGNSFPHKNVSILIEALPEIRRQHADVRLVLAGAESPLTSTLKAKAAALADPDSVVFAGRVDDRELDRLYETAAVFVFPSLSEGFGLPPLEAMSRGLPVVAADASCLPEVLGSAARFFDARNPRDLVRAVNALLDDPAEQERLRSAGLAWAARFPWRRTAVETLTVYRRLLAAP